MRALFSLSAASIWQLLGIGHNGHIGFNEPTDNFPATVHTVQLTESTINANSRLFERLRGCADAGHHHGHRHHYEGEEDSSHRRPG